MPCYKCSNGKYKYGLRGNCQFDTLERCEAAERAINARENKNSTTLNTKEVEADCCKKTDLNSTA
jgi:hypothetical protein